MELELLPENIRNHALIHIQDGYEIESYEDNQATLIKRKPIRVGMFIINLLTLRWVIYKWLPHILVSDLIRIKYYLCISEKDGGVSVTTG